MLNNEELEKVFSATIELWFDDPRGSSAMEISKKLNYEHDDVIKAFAELELQGLGSAKKDVLMYSMTVKIHGSSSETVSTPFQTSIFFPDKNELSNRYHASSLAKLYHPEYTRRLHLGASQVGLVFFSEDVLARYILNPGKFEVRDDLSGGDIRNNSSSTSESFIHIRYGKAPLRMGILR